MIQFALALTCLTLQQSPAAAPAAGSAGGQEDWSRYPTEEAVAALVNDAAISLGALDREFQESRARNPVSTREEHTKLLQETLRDMIEEELRSQGGRDMGYPVDFLNRQVDTYFDRQTEIRGLFGQAEYLQEQVLSPEAAREDVTKRVYRNTWIRSQVGVDPGPDGRALRDRFVRPGAMHDAYLGNRSQFGEPARVSLQVLVILSDQAGGAEEARAYCADFREQVLAGEDMGELVRQVGAVNQASRGVLPAVETNVLSPPEFRTWAESAEPGGVSPLLPHFDATRPNQLAGYRFFKLLEREEGSEPKPFFHAEVQEQLLREIRRVREQNILFLSEQELFQRSNIWTIIDLQ